MLFGPIKNLVDDVDDGNMSALCHSCPLLIFACCRQIVCQEVDLSASYRVTIITMLCYHC